MVLKYPSFKPYPPTVRHRHLTSLHALNNRCSGQITKAYRWASFTPLMLASSHGTALLIRRLVAEGEDINAQDRMFGRTPLIWAITCRNPNIANIRVLIACRANIHTTEFWGRTPLFWAAAYQHTDIVRILVRRGADINAVNIVGETPLIAASKRRRTMSIQTLLDLGARAI